MAYLETIRLVSSGALIMGNAPKKLITLDEVANKISRQPHKKSQIRSFGLFDNNTSNYNTYYPNVTSKDLKPSKDEFIEPVFRALSEVVVHKEYNPVDFSRGKVLRKSMSLLLAQTVNTDHEDAVGNALGSVSEVVWQEAYKDSSGISIPAGINSRLKIDGKSHPRIARAIMMDPPAIHSTSVTVQFLWEKSHPTMDDETFFKNLGAYDKESKLITRVATMVKKYHEISLVSHGADPFAQLIKENGELNNSPYAAVSYNSITGELKKAQKFFSFDFKTDLISNSKKITIPAEFNINQPSQQNKGKVMKTLIGLIASEFGIKEFNSEDKSHVKLLSKKIAKLKADAGKTSVLADLDEAKKEAGSYKQKYEKLKADKIARLKELRALVLKNYTLAVGGKKDDKVVETIKNAKDESVLKTLNDQYTLELSKKYPSSCSDCGSTNITKASAKMEDESEETLTGEQILESIEDEEFGQASKFMH